MTVDTQFLFKILEERGVDPKTLIQIKQTLSEIYLIKI